MRASLVGLDPYERVMVNTVPAENGCLRYTGCIGNRGYGMVTLPPSHGGKQRLAHRVVAEHHYGPSDLHVLHSCDNRWCVEPTHLRYGTDLDNMREAVDRGRIAVGERHGMSKLTAEQVLAIRADQRKQVEIASDYGLRADYVSQIKRRKRWSHI